MRIVVCLILALVAVQARDPFQQCDACPCRGLRGREGRDGPRGKRGQNGLDGTQGLQGNQGQQGTPGTNVTANLVSRVLKFSSGYINTSTLTPTPSSPAPVYALILGDGIAQQFVLPGPSGDPSGFVQLASGVFVAPAAGTLQDFELCATAAPATTPGGGSTLAAFIIQLVNPPNNDGIAGSPAPPTIFALGSISFTTGVASPVQATLAPAFIPLPALIPGQQISISVILDTIFVTGFTNAAFSLSFTYTPS